MTPARHLGLISLTLLFGMSGFLTAAEETFVRYEGSLGPGKGKKIVLVSGDEEYRSEEAMPQLGKILAKHHGFTCTVLFAVDKKDGSINPNQNDNIPGLENLKDADLLILFTRFRNLPEDQMRYLVDYIESGRPMIGLRTATHAFNMPAEKPFAEYSWQSKAEGWDGGFGRKVLGETWLIAPRKTRQPKHKGHHRSRRVESSHLERHQGWRDLGTDRCLRRQAPFAGRQQTAGHGAGGGRHEVHRPARGWPAK